MRDILFVHNNFPGQFVHLARALARTGRWRVFAIGGSTAKSTAGIDLERYEVSSDDLSALDLLVRRGAIELRRARAVAEACDRLRGRGCNPAVVVGHAGWGEMLFLRDAFPKAKIVSYLEFYFSAEGGDVNFDAEFAEDDATLRQRVRARNAPSLFAGIDSDLLVTPTQWQASRFPASIRERLTILHEGVDTNRAAPDPDVRLELEDGTVLGRDHEVLSFVARNLEPYRGFHVFMRALPDILKARPEAHVLIVGGEGASYGSPPPGGGSWKARMLEEVGAELDHRRIHFLGRVPYDVFLGAVQLARAHVYLTYPFVLSWSLLEAMACGALVIGSRTAPVEEVIEHGVNGILVDFFDPSALAKSAIAALASPGDFRDLRAAARRTVVERYDLRTRCLPQMVHAVEALVGPGAGRPDVPGSEDVAA